MSKEARNRALEAICNAQGRTFLAAAPLMAIVEAVQVLDEAGLLVDPDVADLDLDAPIPYTLAVSPKADAPPAAVDEALRRRVERACSAWEDGDGCADDLLAEFRKALDEVEVSDEALALCEAASDGWKAANMLTRIGETLTDEGFVGEPDEQVSGLLLALSSERREVRDLRAATPCEVHFVFEQKPDGDKVFIEAEVGGQSVSVGEWQPDPDEARYVRLVAQVVFSRVESPPAPEPERHILAGSPCFECGQTLNDSGVCTNPKCQSMPF